MEADAQDAARVGVDRFQPPAGRMDDALAACRNPAGEQWTMFLLDPAGNALEFKAFRDLAQLFAR